MSASSLHDLREWLAVGDAAGYLSRRLPDRCSSADVLHLALDGHVGMSLYLPTEVLARCQPRDGAADGAEKHRRIQGLCDIPMAGRAKLQIDHDCRWEETLRLIPIDGPVGAIVEQGDMIYQLPPDRGQSGPDYRQQSEFPQGAVLCVRTSVLKTFAENHRAARPSVSSQKDSPTRPEASAKERKRLLDRRERTSLLVIIAALAEHCSGVDVNNPASAADRIGPWTEMLGGPLDKRTIQNYLAEIPDALERQRKA